MSAVVDNSDKNRFELAVDGSTDFAAAYYRLQGDEIVLTQTTVPDEFAGLRVASLLARGVFDDLRARGRKAILMCPFMTAFYARHPEYADVITDGKDAGDGA